MSGRKNPTTRDNEALRAFRHFQARDRGEAVVGEEASWLGRVDAPRADAESRRSKHRENFRR